MLISNSGSGGRVFACTVAFNDKIGVIYLFLSAALIMEGVRRHIIMDVLFLSTPSAVCVVNGGLGLVVFFF